MVDAVEALTPETMASSATPGSLPRRFVVAATIGNALEFYDFITYAFFAIQIGHTFFPSHSAYGSLMLSLATFGVGFVTRPVGAVVIGTYADRVGRRAAMMFSLTLMGAANIVLVLIPSYATIGVAAPILAIIARMAQGFSLGGEVGPTTAYLLEAAPAHRRGLAVAWQGASQNVAATLGAFVGAVLSGVLARAALKAYGWRIAFLIGALALPYGLWIRRGLPESLHLPDDGGAEATTRSAFDQIRGNARIIILALAALSAATIGTYISAYMVTFAQNTLHLAPGVSFLARALSGVATITSAVFGGWLSDRIGRRPLLIWPNLAYLVMILPIFFWIVSSRSALALVTGTTLLGLISGLNGGAFYATVTEALPKRIRSRVLATVYASAIALFGGTTQLVITWLIRVTGNPMSPALYLFGALSVGQMALMLIGAGLRAARPAAALVPS